MFRFAVRIEGTSPLLMNRFGDAAAQNATDGVRSSMVAEAGTPRDQAAQVLYVHDGVIGIPQPNLYRCLIDAGTFHKVGKSKLTTIKSSLVPTCVTVPGVWLPLDAPQDWEVDIRPVRIPATGGRILRYRPRFDKWALEFEIELEVDGVVTPALARRLVDDAGRKIGLGDFRPATKGPFGRFVVTRWEDNSDS